MGVQVEPEYAIGRSAQVESVLHIFERDARPRLFKQIQTTLSKKECFKGCGMSASDKLREVINEMIAGGLLSVEIKDGSEHYKIT